jgi:hypothetical protein
MKKVIYAATFTLIIASSIPTAWATRKPGDAKFSHLVDSAAYPDVASVRGATHEIEIHVHGGNLSELSIDLPEDMSIRKGIEVTNQSDKKIEANVSVNNRKATVVFSQPVAPETIVSIAMKGVETPGYDNIWQYRVYAKKVGITAEIPLGTARIHTYRD